MPIQFSRPDADLFIPDGCEPATALGRTTDLGIGAHADDLELMAGPVIIDCFGRADRWFSGLVVTDGAGSARADAYASTTDQELIQIRRREQRKAAYVGEYAAQIQLSYPSSRIKTRENAESSGLLTDLQAVLRATRPDSVYTHNPADKHDTHVAVVLRVLEACASLAPSERPRRILGCEVWRDLDWMVDSDKRVMPADQRENLQAALMGVFDSQISGGKRYDLATFGRRRAHATYFESHAGDRHGALVFAMDLSPLLTSSDISGYVTSLIRRFEDEVRERIERLQG